MPTCLLVKTFKPVVDDTRDLEFCTQDSAGGWVLVLMYYVLVEIVFTKVNSIVEASAHYLCTGRILLGCYPRVIPCSVSRCYIVCCKTRHCMCLPES